MHKRFLFLLAIVLLVGAVTHAFAQVAPEQPTTISRAGAVALLVEGDPMLKRRFTMIQAHMPPMLLFKDVPKEHWYAPYVETVFEAGIITGNASKEFRPGDSVTTEEAVTFMTRFLARGNGSVASVLQNASSENWYDTSLQAAVIGELTVPSPVYVGTPMKRDDYHALLASAGIAHSRSLVVQAPPPVMTNPVIVASNPRHASPVPSVTPSPAYVPRPAVQPVRPFVPQPTRTTTPTNSAQTSYSPTVYRETTPQATSVSNQNFAISMPSLGINNLTITHPSDALSKDGLLAPLKYGVGHLFSYPGKGGKILVYGHSSGYAWDVSSYTKIFRQINKLNAGDVISVTYAGQLYKYKVSHKQTVPASDMSVYQRGSGEELILYTCWPPDSISERYLVHARPI